MFVLLEKSPRLKSLSEVRADWPASELGSNLRSQRMTPFRQYSVFEFFIFQNVRFFPLSKNFWWKIWAVNSLHKAHGFTVRRKVGNSCTKKRPLGNFEFWNLFNPQCERSRIFWYFVMTIATLSKNVKFREIFRTKPRSNQFPKNCMIFGVSN